MQRHTMARVIVGVACGCMIAGCATVPNETAAAATSSTAELTFQHYSPLLTMEPGETSITFMKDFPDMPPVPPGCVSDRVLEGYVKIGESSGETRWLLFDESGGSGTGYDTVYFDGNNNGDFSDNAPLSGTSRDRAKIAVGDQPPVTERATTFGPVETAISIDGVPTKREFLVKIRHDIGATAVESAWGALQTSGVYQGTIDLGGRLLLVAITDANCNGVFSDHIRAMVGWPDPNAKSDCDYVHLDLNGDGRFSHSLERFPNTRAAFLTYEHSLYDVRVAGDGTRIEFAPTRVPFGYVKTAMTCKMELSGQKRVSIEGPCNVPLPTGQYEVMSFRCMERDDQGVEWSAGFAGYSSPMILEVEEGRTLEIPYGPPFKAKLSMDSNEDFWMEITGKSGEPYEWYSFNKGGERLPEPEVVVRDSRGAINARGKIPYPYNADMVREPKYEWHTPWPGTYTATLVADLGPFKMKMVPLKVSIE